MENKSSHKILKTILVMFIIILLIIAVTIITLGITNPTILYNAPVIGSLMQSFNPDDKIETDGDDSSHEDENDLEEEPDEDDSESKDDEDKPDDEDVINFAINEEDKNIIPYDDEIEEVLRSYSIGINRIDGNTNNYENNAVLLLIANNFFESKTTASINVDSKYAATKENIHKYLTELTTTDFTEIDHLDSYSNIIRYVKKSNSYAIGSDVNILKRERYSLADLEYTDNGDGTYSGSAIVLRSIPLDDGSRELTNYSINFKFRINERFTYSKYKILSFSAANKDFYPDNTYHLEKN